jgi:hypothetical protein
MTAMRAFAECAEVYPEPVGYCHDSIQDAGYLANHDVCGGLPEDDPATEDVNEALGATTDVGWREAWAVRNCVDASCKPHFGGAHALEHRWHACRDDVFAWDDVHEQFGVCIHSCDSLGIWL